MRLPGALCYTSSGDWTEVANGPGQEASKAKEIAICKVCTVRVECLEAGLVMTGSTLREVTGIWGGLLPKERRAIARKRYKLAKVNI